MTDEKKLIVYRESIIPKGVGLNRKTLTPCGCVSMSCLDCIYVDDHCDSAENRLKSFNNWLQKNDKEEAAKQFKIGEPALFRDSVSSNWALALFTGFENGKFTSTSYGVLIQPDQDLRKSFGWKYIKKIDKGEMEE